MARELAVSNRSTGEGCVAGGAGMLIGPVTIGPAVIGPVTTGPVAMVPMAGTLMRGGVTAAAAASAVGPSTRIPVAGWTGVIIPPGSPVIGGRVTTGGVTRGVLKIGNLLLMTVMRSVAVFATAGALLLARPASNGATVSTRTTSPARRSGNAAATRSLTLAAASAPRSMLPAGIFQLDTGANMRSVIVGVAPAAARRPVNACFAAAGSTPRVRAMLSGESPLIAPGDNVLIPSGSE